MNPSTTPLPLALRIGFLAAAFAANVAIGLCIETLASPTASPATTVTSAQAHATPVPARAL